MKKQSIVLALILGLLAPVVASAKTVEQAYVDSYQGQSVAPKPVSVVSPQISREWAGRELELVFVVDASGRPHAIHSTSRVSHHLVQEIKRAVLRWRFAPRLDANGTPVASRVVLPVHIKRRGDTAAIFAAAN